MPIEPFFTSIDWGDCSDLITRQKMIKEYKDTLKKVTHMPIDPFAPHQVKKGEGLAKPKKVTNGCSKEHKKANKDRNSNGPGGRGKHGSKPRCSGSKSRCDAPDRDNGEG